MKKLLLIAILAFGLAIPSAASAKVLKGKTGIGGEATDWGGALSVKHWLGSFAIQGLLGFQMFSPDADEADSQMDFALGLRGLFNVARANETNLEAGVGIRLGILTGRLDEDTADPLDTTTKTAITIDLLMAVEHFFTDHFSVTGSVTLPIHLNPDLAPGSAAEGLLVRMGNMGWGGGFTFYF